MTGVYDHAGYKESCKDFTVALKIFNVFNKIQMYDSVFTGKEIASKNWNCILFLFGYACSMCSLYVSRRFILAFLRKGMAFLVNMIACRRLVMAAENCSF